MTYEKTGRGAQPVGPVLALVLIGDARLVPTHSRWLRGIAGAQPDQRITKTRVSTAIVIAGIRLCRNVFDAL
jgi:hypothetical protein